MKLRVRRGGSGRPDLKSLQDPPVLREMSLEACEDLGVDLLREGEVEAALFCLREAMERGTQDPVVRKAYLQAMLLLFSRVDLERLEGRSSGPGLDTRETREALLVLSEANVRKWPEDADNHLFHGMCLAGLGRYAEAVQAYDRGLTLDPEDACLQRARRGAEKAREVLGR